ncbi:hypothetical protein HC928_25075, partial [bacterium]|nr:hypothetical protein [bacterium]
MWINNNVAAVNMINTTISGNTAVADAGGGMFLNTPDGKPVKITNTSIVNNLAGRDAGAIWTGGRNSDDVKVTNTLFARNTATTTKQGHSNFTLAEGGGNIVQTIPGGRGPKVTTNSRYVADLRLSALQLNGNDLVHPLLTDSPAINSGVTSNAPTTDQRGILRDSQPDSGAFELISRTRQQAKVRLTNRSPQSQLIDLRTVDLNKDGKGDRRMTAKVRKIGNTDEFDDVIGFYVVTNAEGAVFDTHQDKLIRPGEAGYAQAALQNRLTPMELQPDAVRLTTTIESGALLAPYVIANGTAKDFLQTNPQQPPQ